MFGRSYKIGRHMGRMTFDSRQRMSNRAEVGLGMIGTLSIVILVLMVIVLFT